MGAAALTQNWLINSFKYNQCAWFLKMALNCHESKIGFEFDLGLDLGLCLGLVQLKFLLRN